MSASKFSPLFYLIIVFLFSTGCWSPEKESATKQTTGTFYVAKADGQSTGHNIVNKDWNIPQEKNFRFWACVEDKVTKSKLRNQKFIVEKHDSVNPMAIPVETTENGCVYWREEGLTFDYYAPSRYLVFTRTLRAADDSVHKGLVKIKLLVNPWASYRAAKGFKPNEVIWWPEGTQSPIDENVIVEGEDNVSQAMKGMGVPQEERGKLFVHNISMMRTKLADVYFSRKQEDFAKKNKEHAKEYKEKFGEPDRDELEARKADEVVSGFDMEVLLEMNPAVQVKNINGDIVYLDVPQGKFRVLAELIATNLGKGADQNLLLTGDKSDHIGKEDQEILTPNAPPVEVDLINKEARTKGELTHFGLLRPRIQATVTRRVTQGRLKLAMRVVPVDAPSMIDPYEGLYVIGNYKRLEGANGLKLVRDSHYEGNRNFDFYKYMADSANFEELKDTYAFHMKPFDFSLAKGNYVMVLPGETATQRTVAFRVETCIFDNATQTGRQQFKQFRIKRDGIPIPLEDSRTNEEGCLILLGKVSHAFYKIEELKPTVFEIEYDAPNLVAKKNGLKTNGTGKYTLTVYTNPWDDKFTFFRDERKMSKELKEMIAAQRKIESRFFISSFSYQTLRFGYEIDRFLNLTVEKSVLLRMEPYVLRYSGNVPGRNNIQRLRDGIYLMKVAYQKDYLDPATKGVLVKRETEQRINDPAPREYYKAQVWDPNINSFRDLTNDEKRHKTKQHLSVVKKLVRVNNGKIITPITLRVADIRLMRVRSQLLIQLEPVDERLVQVANAYNDKAAEDTYKDISEKFKGFLRTNKKDFDQILESHTEENDQRRVEALRRYKDIWDRFEAKQSSLIRSRIMQAEKRASKKKGYVALSDQQIEEYVESEMESRRNEFDEYLDTFSPDLPELDKARAKYNVLPEDEKLKIKEDIKLHQDNLDKLLKKLASDKLSPAQRNALVTIGIDPEGRQVVDTMAFDGTEFEDMDVFSPLMQEFDIFDETKQSLLSKTNDLLQLNDFTYASAQAFVEDLDVLVEPFEKSGLAARTFIGPITFLLNSNHSSVRPTDNIDEKFCRTDDCDNFKSWGNHN